MNDPVVRVEIGSLRVERVKERVVFEGYPLLLPVLIKKDYSPEGVFERRQGRAPKARF